MLLDKLDHLQCTSCNCAGIYPILAALWAVVSLPLQAVRLFLIFADNAIDGLTDLVQFIFISMSPAISTIKSAKAATPPPSLWRALWNDIFSKVRFTSEMLRSALVKMFLVIVHFYIPFFSSLLFGQSFTDLSCNQEHSKWFGGILNSV